MSWTRFAMRKTKLYKNCMDRCWENLYGKCMKALSVESFRAWKAQLQ